MKTADAHNKDYVGYFQVIEQSDDEKIKMYMKLTKRELAEMLVEANKMLSDYMKITLWKELKE